jgi:hypothetical protein
MYNKTYTNRYGETDIVVILPKKGKEEKEEEQAKSGYWQNELYSLGISEPKLKKKEEEEEVKDNKAELENLSDIIKEAMFEDYKLAYSEEGEAHKEEAESTVTVG